MNTGGLSGIVTVNDLLEQLVGDFDEEGTEEEAAPEVERVDSQTWRIQGQRLWMRWPRSWG